MLRLSPMTLRDYDLAKQHARVRNTFPVLSVMDAANVTLDGITVDGNRAENAYIDGCRGGAIYMYDVRNVTVKLQDDQQAGLNLCGDILWLIFQHRFNPQCYRSCAQ